jgi:hypothetical protein
VVAASVAAAAAAGADDMVVVVVVVVVVEWWSGRKNLEKSKAFLEVLYSAVCQRGEEERGREAAIKNT